MAGQYIEMDADPNQQAWIRIVQMILIQPDPDP